MTQQTNALRLADALASQWNQLDPVDPFRADVGAASEELRRLDALSAGDAVDEPQSTPIACAVHVAGRTFEKGVPFCDVIDYIESNTTRWVASSDRYPPEGERVFFVNRETIIQKLREAFESRMTDNGKWPNAIKQGRNGCYLLAQTENAWTEWQACAEALALPTADHLPDVKKMVVDHFPDATKMIDSHTISAVVAECDMAILAKQPATGVPDDVVRDAERYRFIRDGSGWPAVFAAHNAPEPLRGDDLDSAIDAAMRKAKP